MRVRIRNATWTERDELRRIAASHPATRAFAAPRFSSEQAYAAGWIRCAEVSGRIVGLSCVRQRVRDPGTSLYFLVVAPEARRQGVGEALLRDVMERSPVGDISLVVNLDDPDAIRFYIKRGFTVSGTEAHSLRMHWKRTA